MTDILTQGPIFLISLIFMLGIVVVVHELGHYWAGRWFGAAAESFSVGFGKPIFERKDARGTRWRVNWIPLGGFVKFVGEGQLAGDVGRIERGPVGKPFPDLTVGQRSVVAVAGPLANFVLAALIFAVILMVEGSVQQKISAAEIQPGSPAAAAGIEAGDVFTTINGKRVDNLQTFLLPIHLGAGDPVDLGIDRGGTPLQLTVTPERQVRDNGLGQQVSMGTIGVQLSAETLAPKTYNPATALVGGVKETGDTLDMTVKLLTRLVTGKEPLSSLSGPVGIGDVTRRVVNRTLEHEGLPPALKLRVLALDMLQICALVSVGIGLFNLLPLPVLDGGHLVFNAYEAVTGKALPEKIQEASLTAGLILLLAMFVVVTWGDVIETGVFGEVGG